MCSQPTSRHIELAALKLQSSNSAARGSNHTNDAGLCYTSFLRSHSGTGAAERVERTQQHRRTQQLEHNAAWILWDIHELSLTRVTLGELGAEEEGERDVSDLCAAATATSPYALVKQFRARKQSVETLSLYHTRTEWAHQGSSGLARSWLDGRARCVVKGSSCLFC